ncbi:hypothetical protein ABIE28_001756 [Devosia sp. 2618]
MTRARRPSIDIAPVLWAMVYGLALVLFAMHAMMIVGGFE